MLVLRLFVASIAVLALCLISACDGTEEGAEPAATSQDGEAGEDEDEDDGEGSDSGSEAPDEPAVTGQILDPIDLSAELLHERIDMAKDYLAAAVDADGRFTYRINLSGETPRPAYNVLRHAGTIYALGQVHERGGEPEVAKPISRATDYLIQRYVRTPEDGSGWLAVFSRPDEESLDTDGPEAKLGGAGLALLAMDAARDSGALDVNVETMKALGRFMLFMQHGDGSFHSKYSESEGYLAFQSLYYPGEAILGFIRLYEAEPDPRWLRAAALGTAHLVETRRGETDLPADHWLMLAMEPLLGLYGQLDQPPVSATEIREHMLQLGLSMISEQEEAERDGGPSGSFARDGRCTPTATRLEGLAALWRSMGAWGLDSDRARVADSVGRGTQFLLTCQVLEGEGIGGVLRAQKPLDSADSSFNRRQAEIRIDYVQHAISAMYGALDVLFEETPRD